MTLDFLYFMKHKIQATDLTKVFQLEWALNKLLIVSQATNEIFNCRCYSI